MVHSKHGGSGTTALTSALATAALADLFAGPVGICGGMVGGLVGAQSRRRISALRGPVQGTILGLGAGALAAALVTGWVVPVSARLPEGGEACSGAMAAAAIGTAISAVPVTRPTFSLLGFSMYRMACALSGLSAGMVLIQGIAPCPASGDVSNVGMLLALSSAALAVLSPEEQPYRLRLLLTGVALAMMHTVFVH